MPIKKCFRCLTNVAAIQSSGRFNFKDLEEELSQWFPDAFNFTSPAGCARSGQNGRGRSSSPTVREGANQDCDIFDEG
jgi:hypothetical protein